MIRIHHNLKRAAFLFATVSLSLACFIFSAGAAQSGTVDGGNVRLRTEPSTESEIVTTLQEGDALEILDSSSSDWLQVSRTSADGTVSSGYISRDLVRIDAMVNNAGVTQTATINAGGVLLCTAPNAGSATDVYLDADSVVTLLSCDSSAWQLISFTNEDGTVSGYVPQSSLTLAPMAIGYSNHESTPLYTQPSVFSEVSLQLEPAALIQILDSSGGWYLVRTDNAEGYVRAADITTSYDYYAMDHGISTGDGLRLRENADTGSKTLTTLSAGVIFQITSDAVDGWYATRYNGKTGYISADYVSMTNAAGGYIQVTAPTLSLMSGAGNSFSVMAEIEQGTVLTIDDVFGNWYLVSYEGFSGFVNSAYTSATTKNGYYDGVNGSNIGAQIAAYACQFAGNPYQWGGTSLTNGADCSGFVLKVYQNFGVSLPHSSAAMRGVGRAVSYSEMQPGDIVCYSGHVGIYAGNGQIINALGEKWGITYTNVNYKSIITIRRIF